MPNSSTEQGNFLAQVAELRRAFDQTFAEAIASAEQSGDLVLSVRAGTAQHAIRLSEVAGVHQCPKIVPLPGVKPACLGVVGLRGCLHGVFRLSTLLGAPPTQTQLRWLIVALGRDAPAFAVESIDACLAIAPEELRAVGHAGDATHHVRALHVRDGVARELLNVPSLIASVTSGAFVPQGAKA